MQSVFGVRRIAVTLAAVMGLGFTTAIAASDPPAPPPVPSDVYVTLSTQFRGLGVLLDIPYGRWYQADGEWRYDTVPFLAQIPPGAGSGRAWLIVQDKDPYLYTIRTAGSASGSEMCLQASTHAEEKQPKMMPCARYAEQQWRFRKDGDFYRIHASVTGLDVCLDIVNGGPTDGQVTLEPCAEFSGQFWVFTPTGQRVGDPPTVAAVPPSETERCKAMVQDQVHWDPANPSAKRWQEQNLDFLCKGTTDAAATVACFQAELERRGEWVDAASFCDADPATIPKAASTPDVPVDVPVDPPIVTVDPPVIDTGSDDVATPPPSEAERCKAMLQGQVRWDPANPGSTNWQEDNLSRLCNGTPDAAATVACFQAELQRAGNWSDAIAACDADPATVSRAPSAVGGTPQPDDRPSDPNESAPVQN